MRNFSKGAFLTGFAALALCGCKQETNYPASQPTTESTTTTVVPLPGPTNTVISPTPVPVPGPTQTVTATPEAPASGRP